MWWCSWTLHGRNSSTCAQEKDKNQELGLKLGLWSGTVLLDSATATDQDVGMDDEPLPTVEAVHGGAASS